MKHIPETPPQIVEFPRKGFRELYLLEDTFSAGIFLLTGITRERYSQWLQEHTGIDDPEKDKDYTAFHSDITHQGNTYNVIVIHEKWTWKRHHWGLLVHELHHAVTNILNRKGIKHSDETEEVWAYLQESMLERFIWGLSHRSRILHRPRKPKKQPVKRALAKKARSK